MLKKRNTSTAAAVQTNSAVLSLSAMPDLTITPALATSSPFPTLIHEQATPGAAPTDTPEAVARPGASVTAPFLDKPPVLDGIWDEWTSPAYPVTSLVYGASQWSGPGDLGGSFRIGWDNKYLYLAVKVGDDAYVQEDSEANIYKGDSLEILLDTDVSEDFETAQLNSDDYRLGISPGRTHPGNRAEAYLWFPKNIAGPRPKVRIGAVGEINLYRVEVAVPWSVFEITPTPGMHLGFVLRINDDDDPDTDALQSAVHNVPGSSLADPTTWGDLVLTK